jgi:hypothetical protein
MSPDEFDRLVGAAYARIPARFRKRMKNIALLVEPEPSAHQLARGHVPAWMRVAGPRIRRGFAKLSAWRATARCQTRK